MSKKGRKTIPRIEQTPEEFLYEQGRDARMDNQPREACPYVTGEQVWQEGWDSMDREIPRMRAAAE